MKKYLFLLVSLQLFTSIGFCQKEKYLSTGMNTGIGFSAMQMNFGKMNFTNEEDGIISPRLNFYCNLYGYHIPITLQPIQFGTAKWRIGLAASYEYVNYLKAFYKFLEENGKLYNSPSLQNPAFEKINQYQHLVKVGAHFEYDFWQKGKNALGMNANFGYYFIAAQNAFGTDAMQAPFLYGGLGLQASYTLAKNLHLVYGLGLNIQGCHSQETILADVYHPVTFQPAITVGIRKSFLLKHKTQ